MTTNTTNHRPAVLILEDDLVHGSLLKMVLEEAELEVHLASAASEAIQIATERMPDMILVEWDSDGIDGRAMLTFLRMRMSALAQVPLALMTDREISSALRGDLALEGYDWILQKPLVMTSMPKLIRRSLAEAHAKPRASRPDQRVFGRYIECGSTASNFNLEATVA